MKSMLILLLSVNADVAELADALVLGTSVNDVGVQVPSSAPMTFLFEIYRTDRYKNHSVKWMIFLLYNKCCPAGIPWGN